MMRWCFRLRLRRWWVRRFDARARVRHNLGRCVVMPGPTGQAGVDDLDRRPTRAGAHGGAAIRNRMTLGGSRVLPGTLVMVFVPCHGRRRSPNWLVIRAMPWTADLTGPQQLRDQEK